MLPGAIVTGGVFPVSSGAGPLPEQAIRATGKAASSGSFIFISPGMALFGPMGRQRAGIHACFVGGFCV
ncbi:hypothetical protein P0F65_15470 [Sphingomonas sp. I4]